MRGGWARCRARDTRLGREVAIKVLPAEKLSDPARRARFEQEARAVAALNHPHIVTIHEIESAGGVDFIVMELVAGKTLDALIPRHGMRFGEVLRIAIPLADALAAAHGAGIVHRDLKPANGSAAFGWRGGWRERWHWWPAVCSSGARGGWSPSSTPRAAMPTLADRRPEKLIASRWADGGPAVQVTRGGGFDAQESWDARYLYYSKLPRDQVFSVVGGGVWRVAVEGGEETPVVRATEQWALSRTGIYWPTHSRGWNPEHTIHFFDFESGRTETIFRTQGPFNGLWLAVSPDEKWLLYNEAPFTQFELMLVENFR